MLEIFLFRVVVVVQARAIGSPINLLGVERAALTVFPASIPFRAHLAYSRLPLYVIPCIIQR